MSKADTSRSQLRYKKESTWDTKATGNYKNITHTGESLVYNINTTTSSEIRSDRQITDLVQTDASSNGGINFELRAAALDDFMESALQSTFSTAVAVSRTDISAASTDNSYNTAAGDFTTENLSVGQWIDVGGFTGNAGNNGNAKVVSITALKLVVSGLTLTNETAGDTVTMAGQMLRNGTAETSYTFESEFSDITEFLWWSGMAVDTMNLEVASGSIATANFSFLGGSHGTGQTTIGGSAVAATSGDLLNGVNNVSNLREGGAAVASGIYIQKLSISVANGLRPQQAIGSLAPIGIGNGSCNVTGSIDIYYSNDTLYSKFVNATSTSISYKMVDSSGNGYVVTLPNIKFTGGSPNAGGANADVILPLAFQCLRDPTLNATIQIDKF